MFVMGTSTAVSVEEYLSTVYRPDCDYVEGTIQERNLGEKDHSRLQTILGAYLLGLEQRLGIHVYTGQRLQVKPDRFLVPDLCVVAGPEPDEQVFTRPPFLCVEILSSEDRMIRVEERISDYLGFGVRYVWVVNPQAGTGWIYSSAGPRFAHDGLLTTEDPEIAVPLGQLLKRR
jgi:Uma2 family endonuclease